MSRKKLETSLEQQVGTATEVENISESTTETPTVSKYAKKVMKKIKARNVLAITLPILTFSLGFGSSHLMSRDEISTLNQQTISLKSNVATLTSENIQLLSTNKQQTESIAHDYILLDDYQDLQERYTALQNDYSDLSDKFDTTNQEKKDVESKYKKLVQTVQVSDTVVYDENNVTKTSGASVATLNKILEGTWLAGYGEIFYNEEKEHGINALFSIGNSILETGWDGDNYLARNKNNIYGLATDRYFESKQECIKYWFHLIDTAYVDEGLTSAGSINAKYCPPNARWSSDITWIVNKLCSKANITIR